MALAAQSDKIPPGWGPSMQLDYPFRIWNKDIIFRDLSTLVPPNVEALSSSLNYKERPRRAYKSALSKRSLVEIPGILQEFPSFFPMCPQAGLSL
eukprot:12934759-Prorocentrum_lima.AAC.1